MSIKLEFSEPGEVSSTSSGRDRLIIELKDIRLFKSVLTGETMQLDQFSGKPELSFEMPPIVSNIETIESIKESTDMVSKITTFLSSANFGVGMILGGSMQQLYGLIRSMQLILLSFLSDVAYPAHAYVFFQGGILFAGMDVFSGEDLYEKYLQFKETSPINKRFEEFGMGDKIFTSNSGSYLIMQALIPLTVLIKLMVVRVCVKMSKYFIFRKLGMSLGKHDPTSIK
jgi:hypothetical protein